MDDGRLSFMFSSNNFSLQSWTDRVSIFVAEEKITLKPGFESGDDRGWDLEAFSACSSSSVRISSP